MAFEWNFRELMRPRLANAYANRTWETTPTQPTEPMPEHMDPNGQAWLAAQQARNAQNMQGYIPNDAKQGYGYDYEDRSQSIPGEVNQDYYGNAGGDRGATAAQVTPNQIKEIQSQIEVIEKRLAENKAKLQNWGGVANKIAAIEARKVNSQDPTSIWRWKESQDYQKAQRAEELKYAAQLKKDAKAEQKQAFLNKLNATLPTMTVGLTTTPDQAQMYKNTLAGLEAEMANYGITDDRIAALKDSLYGDLPYNAMMSAIDELNEIDANYGKGSDYDRMNDDQKFSVYQKKLEEARQKLMNENPALWEMIKRDSTYSNKFNNLLSNRRPKSKGKDPVRAHK